MGRLVGMAQRFHQSVEPEWPWDAEAVASFFDAVIERGFCTISADGFMAGGMAAHPLAPAWVVASEYLWWAEDGTGAAHAARFVRWAKAQGASEIRWSCRADNERVAAFFGKRANPVEQHFSEVLPCV